VQEGQSGLDNLRSLESFGHIHLKSIQGNFPIISDFAESIVNDLPCASPHANFDQNSFFLFVFFKH